MSKINKIQTVALTAQIEEVAPAKPVTKAAPATKTTTVKKPATNTTAKPVAAKTATAKTPALKQAPVKAKTEKPAKEKVPKLKMERDSFTMPKTEYAQFSVLKARMDKLGQPVKKSELIRAGLMQLSAMTDAALKAAMGKVPAIKTGRPKNK